MRAYLSATALAVVASSAVSLAIAQTRTIPLASAKEVDAPKASSLNPQTQEVVNQLKSLGGKPINTLPPAEARKQPGPPDAIKALLTKKGKSTAPEPVGKVEDRNLPGPGGQIPVRVYTPKGSGPFPVVVYFHGGGWVIANLDTYDASARGLANASGAVVVSVAYRQAPEHKFPAAADDSYAATQYVMSHAADFGGKPDKIAVAGESAGGNLATVVCLMAKDKGGKMPVYQLLVYPITDYNFTRKSYTDSADGPILTKDMMVWFWKQYMRTEADGANKYASPLRADVSGLPPAMVITDGFDVLRSEGVAYAEKLKQAGVRVNTRHYDAQTHEFFGMGAIVDESKAAVQAAGAALKAALQ